MKDWLQEAKELNQQKLTNELMLGNRDVEMIHAEIIGVESLNRYFDQIEKDGQDAEKFFTMLEQENEDGAN